MIHGSLIIDCLVPSCSQERGTHLLGALGGVHSEGFMEGCQRGAAIILLWPAFFKTKMMPFNTNKKRCYAIILVY